MDVFKAREKEKKSLFFFLLGFGKVRVRARNDV